MALTVLALVGALAASTMAARTVARTHGAAMTRLRRDVAWTLVACCAVTAAVTVAAAVRWEAAVPSALREPVRGVQMVAEGTVVSEPRDAPRDAWTGAERTRFAVAATVACATPCTEPRRVAMTVEVVGAAGTAPTLGQRVRVEGAVSGARDTRKAGSLWDASVTNLGTSDVVLGASAMVRSHARDVASTLPDEVRGLTLGMVIGDTSQIPADLQADMRTAGLTHLTAVSGSHFALITLTVGWLVRRLMRPRWLRALALAASMSALTVVVLPDPSVVRALTMALAVALGWWWGRPARALPAMGAGLIALLLWEPGLAGTVGLQLSVLAVFAIVTWSPRLAVVLGRWFIAGVAKAVAVPLAAWLACWPLLVALNPGVGPYAVPANLVAAVAAAPVTVIGLLATLVSLIWEQGGAALMGVAGLCAWPVVWAARAFAAAPSSWIGWPMGAGGVSLACAVTLSVVVASASDRLRVGLRLAAVLIAVVLAGASPLWTVSTGPVTTDWRVVQCDVGQGDMMMVRTGEHAAVVIDSGPPGGTGRDCLDRYHVTSVPLLVLSHPHADHDGALAELAEVARIDKVWTSPAVRSLGHDVAVTQAASLGIPVDVAVVGSAWTSADGSVRVSVLAPPASATTARSSSEINDASLVAWITAGPLSVLALGDLEEPAQDALARALSGPVVVDLVKVAHHGSASQSRALAALLTARVAVVSVGADNSYGHPATPTVDLYRSRALMVLTTAACGDIAMRDDYTVAAACPQDMGG